MLEICLPGTGGMAPLPHRYLTCCWMESQGQAILIDCGEGTQVALTAAGCKMCRMEALLLTHFHADHVAGMPGLLLTLGNQGKTSPLVIAGPRGVGRVVTNLLTIAPALPFAVEVVELTGQEVLLAGLHITYAPLDHKVPCLGYRAELRRKPIFNPQKAEALNIPKPEYKRLHAGESIVVDGKTITPDMVLDGEREPLCAAYCTDSRPIDAIARLASGVDLFICEGMYGEAEMHDKMQEKGHMLFADAAQLALQAQAKELWLTHYSPALKHPAEFLDAATAVFEQTRLGQDGLWKSI